MTNDEFLRLIHDAYRSVNEDELDDYVDPESWIPSEPEVKKKALLNIINTIDATNLKRKAIEGIINKSKQITVGKFMITSEPYTEETLSYIIYESTTKTPSGFPCKMQIKVNVEKDNRFSGTNWRNLFHGCYGRKIPTSTCVDIIKWLQAINKLIVFM
jgi:hypothetical protein